MRIPFDQNKLAIVISNHGFLKLFWFLNGIFKVVIIPNEDAMRHVSCIHIIRNFQCTRSALALNAGIVSSAARKTSCTKLRYHGPCWSCTCELYQILLTVERFVMSPANQNQSFGNGKIWAQPDPTPERYIVSWLYLFVDNWSLGAGVSIWPPMDCSNMVLDFLRF